MANNFNTLVFLKGFNNYFNRIVKKYNTLQEYTASASNFYSRPGRNFNPADGVYAEHVENCLNSSNVDEPLEQCDYVLVCSANNEIVSRWFITECDRTRNNQYKFSLRRDVIADYYSNVINAKTYIQKATLPAGNELIYNQEAFNVNQIKKEEIKLTDYTGMAWLVGYYDRNHTSEMSGEVEANDTEDLSKISIGVPIETWQYYQYSNLSGNPRQTRDFTTHLNSWSYSIWYDQTGWFFNRNLEAFFDSNGNCLRTETSSRSTHTLVCNHVDDPVNRWTNIMTYNKTSIKNAFISSYIDLSVYNSLRSYDNKYIVDSNGKVFLCKIKNDTAYGVTVLVRDNALYTTLNNIIITSGLYNSGNCSNAISASYSTSLAYLELIEQPNLAVKWDLSSTSKTHTLDAPYDMFCIPYTLNGEPITMVDVGYTVGYVDQTSSMNTINAIAYQKPGYVYDIQLLPYCPLSNLDLYRGSNNELCLDLSELSSSDYSLVKPDTGGASTVKSIIFNCAFTSFTGNITDKPISMTSDDTLTEAENIKVNNELNIYRLVSPNFNGQFEFSVAKNGGVDTWNYDCTYKPYSPYIKINPNFKNLYGADWNDATGLICGGNFSLPIMNDQFKNYEIQNKNYQIMFNREIENLDVNHSIDRTQAIIGAITGTVQGAAAGAIGGSQIGGATGGAIGAGIGAMASAAGGAADVALSEKRYKENRDYAIDNFNYNLQNIKARPNSITQLTSFNENNKKVPIIEKYECTDVEKAAFINKLRYDGMTVMVIGTISDYLQNDPSYIKGEIIRMEDIEDDNHIADEIYNEIRRGVYI